MMNVIKIGNMYKATRITGPQHNFLGLVLSEDISPSLTIESLLIDDGERGVKTIDEQELVDAVKRGVTKANAAFSTQFHIERLQYVPTDTPNPAAYEALARHIVEYASMELRAKAPATAIPGSQHSDDCS